MPRYNDFTEFTNPTDEDFIGVWEREFYEIKAHAKELFPSWLSKHFAKRIADREMIKAHGKPLLDSDPKRAAFVAKCISIESEHLEEEKPISGTRAQIEADRQKLLAQKAKQEPKAVEEEVPDFDEATIEAVKKTGSARVTIPKRGKSGNSETEIEFAGDPNEAAKSLLEHAAAANK